MLLIAVDMNQRNNVVTFIYCLEFEKTKGKKRSLFAGSYV